MTKSQIFKLRKNICY